MSSTGENPVSKLIEIVSWGRVVATYWDAKKTAFETRRWWEDEKSGYWLSEGDFVFEYHGLRYIVTFKEARPQ